MSGRHPVIPPRQAGRTLVELMVAMGLGLMLISAVAALLWASSNTSRIAHQLGTVSEQAQASLQLIGRSVKRAGFGEVVGSDMVDTHQTLFDGAPMLACRNGRFNDPTVGDYSCVAGGTVDTLMVQFQADSVVGPDEVATRNCVGGAGENRQILTNAHPARLATVPYVTNVYEVVSNTLGCRGNGSTRESLIDDVREFRVYFGFDEAAFNAAAGGVSFMAPAGARIVDADFITNKGGWAANMANSPWTHVVSVHLCMVVRTRDTQVSAQGSSATYTGCPDTAAQVISGAPTRTASDAAVYRTFTQVFTVRSQASGSPSIGVPPP